LPAGQKFFIISYNGFGISEVAEGIAERSGAKILVERSEINLQFFS
jgi:hypothetical protein